MEFPQVDGAAPADSPLGLLERGRGAGWTHATTSEAGVGLLLACLRREPRWDRQVEERADYYATLAVRLEVPASVIASLAPEGGDDDDRIAPDVLAAMARRGAAVRESPQVVHDDAPTASRKRTEPVPADAPIGQLLKVAARPPFRRAVLHRLRTTTDAREVNALRRASRYPDHPGWWLALRALALRGDPAPLPTVEGILERNQSGPKRAAAFQYVRGLPASVSLPVARRWLSTDDGRCAVAEAVLADHAELADASTIRDALAGAHDYYAISSLVQALGRLAEAGPFPELDEVYERSAYSYARARAVTAIAATDPEFAHTWATECLWDCEGSARAQGARFAPLEVRAVTRLQQLADDPFEDSDVRAASRARLNA